MIVRANGRIAVDTDNIGAITLAKRDLGLSGVDAEYCLNVKSKTGGDLVAVSWTDETYALDVYNKILKHWTGTENEND